MSAANVQLLKDMGFAESIALEALKYTNDNPDAAVTFIMDGSLPETMTAAPSAPPPPPPPRPSTGNVQTEGYTHIEPGILDEIQNIHSSVHQESYNLSPEHIEYVSGQRLSKSQEQQHTHDGIPLQQEYDVFDDVTRYKNYNPQHVPSVIMPLTNGYYENYITSLIIVLYQVPEFRFKILSCQFEDLGFAEDWFRGNRVVIDPHVYKKEINGKVHDLRFLLELQRLFIFLDNDKSSRFFASVKQFILNIPAKIFHDQENLSDIISATFEWLCMELKVIDIDIDSLLKSTTKNAGSHNLQDHYSFPVELELLKFDIYQTFYEQIWNPYENCYNLCFQDLSDILTFVIQQDNDVSSSNGSHTGIRLSERFYPGVFTEHYGQIFKELTLQQQKLKESISKKKNQVLKFKSHNGKRVSGFLSATDDFFQSEGLMELSDELKAIQEKITHKEHTLNEKIARYADEIDHRCPSNIKNIMGYADELNLPAPESYLLISVIISDIAYAFLKRDKSTNTNKWTYVEFNSPRVPGHNFEVRDIDFESLRTHIRKLTNVNNLREPIVIVYGKESQFNHQVTSENYYPALTDFADFDEANLENQVTSELPDYEDSESEADLIDLEEGEEQEEGEEESPVSNAVESKKIEISEVEPEVTQEQFDFDEDDLEICEDEEKKDTDK
ncbi:hypothetical protein WICPIJ_004553 [Wickerhamomyces pijperi]|uniref:UBA domain-containing protein n=1 Tax=Wickerhamomyces pijperi TaxID=599730 RepID=A0A9P8Q7S3_WICPI|nr:hypothetical protein WICPIJ_004553 [Wickerhamomyces pijperi]